MKKLLIPAVISIAAMSMNSYAAINGQKDFKFVGDTQYAGLCEAAATDNVELFNQTVKEQLSWMKTSKHNVLKSLVNADKFSCAGKGLLEFANEYGAEKLLTAIKSDKVELNNGARVRYVGDTQYAGFCKAALTNDVALFKKTARRHVGSLAASQDGVLDLVLDADKVQCAGLGLIEFSEQRKATKVMEYIATKRA